VILLEGNICTNGRKRDSPQRTQRAQRRAFRHRLKQIVTDYHRLRARAFFYIPRERAEGKEKADFEEQER